MLQLFIDSWCHPSIICVQIRLELKSNLSKTKLNLEYGLAENADDPVRSPLQLEVVEEESYPTFLCIVYTDCCPFTFFKDTQSSFWDRGLSRDAHDTTITNYATTHA
jgi:hypothetical protein